MLPFIHKSDYAATHYIISKINIRLGQDPVDLPKTLIPRPGSRWFNGLNTFSVTELLSILRQAVHVDDSSTLSSFDRANSDTSSIGGTF